MRRQSILVWMTVANLLISVALFRAEPSASVWCDIDCRTVVPNVNKDCSVGGSDCNCSAVDVDGCYALCSTGGTQNSYCPPWP